MEIDELETADEEVKSGTSSTSGSSVRSGVGVGRLRMSGDTVVESGVNAGRFAPVLRCDGAS